MGQDRNLRGDKTTDKATALIICDVISDFTFPGAQRFLPRLKKIAPVIGRLRDRADAAGAAVIYVNDNVGAWRSDRASVLGTAMSTTSRMPREVQQILPRDDDYLLLKPQYSAFFGTPLDSLLFHLGVSRLVVTGIATEICVLFSAHDAYLRGFGLHVPRDGCAGISDEAHASSLALMSRALKTDVRSARAVRFR